MPAAAFASSTESQKRHFMGLSGVPTAISFWLELSPTLNTRP